MAIDLNSLSNTQANAARSRVPTQTGDARGGERQSEALANSGQRGDTVRLSEAAQALQNAGKQMSQQKVDDFDADKVAQIKLALEQGSYVIDNERLAARMIDFEKLFE